MNEKPRQIEVDAATAEALEARAAERGVSVNELLADLAGGLADAAAESDTLAELERRWAKIEGGTPTIANDDVVRWLETWGTPRYAPWARR